MRAKVRVGSPERRSGTTRIGFVKQVGFQRHGEAYRKGPSVVLREDDVSGRARVTTDEE